MIFFTSDLHFNDERLDVYSRDFRFNNSEEVDKAIVDGYNSMVEDNDTVYFLGDISMDKKGFENLNNMNGNKILIKGNYDKKYSDDFLLEYFDEVGDKAELVLSNGEKVYLNHYPTEARADLFNIVGHIHGCWKVQKNMLNVGVDAWHFKPVPEDKVLFQMNGIRNFYDENVFAEDLPANKG